RAVSDTSLVVERQCAETAEYLVSDVCDFVRACRRRQHACGQPAADGLAGFVALDEVGVAIVLQETSDAVQRVVPGDAFPFVGTRRPVLWVLQAVRAVDEVRKGGALRTERAAVDRVVGI